MSQNCSFNAIINSIRSKYVFFTARKAISLRVIHSTIFWPCRITNSSLKFHPKKSTVFDFHKVWSHHTSTWLRKKTNRFQDRMVFFFLVKLRAIQQSFLVKKMFQTGKFLRVFFCVEEKIWWKPKIPFFFFFEWKFFDGNGSSNWCDNDGVSTRKTSHFEARETLYKLTWFKTTPTPE